MAARRIDHDLEFLQSHLDLDRAPAGFPPLDQTLGRSGDPRAFQALMVALSSGGEYIRSLAANGLSYFGNRSAIPELVRVLRTDAGIYVRGDAALALGRLGSEESINDLQMQFERDSFEVEKRIIMALGMIGGTRSKTALKLLLPVIENSDLNPEQKSVLQQMVDERMRLD